MPVWKFRSIEEMNRHSSATQIRRAGDPSIVNRMRFLWQLTSSFGPLCIPRGVRKYRSIEEAAADRDRWEKERIELWRRLRRS